MTDAKTMGMDPALFHLRASSDGRSLATARTGVRERAGGTADLESASRQFEALLLNFMIREMRATVPESGLYPRSMAEEIYTSMLDERVAGEMAENGGIGLSRMLIDQLKAAEDGE